MTTLACMSDIHGMWNKIEDIKWPRADILIIAGDILPNFYSSRGCHKELVCQLGKWIELNEFVAHKLPYRDVIAIAGNHDFLFQKAPATAKEHTLHIKYLREETIIIQGLKFYGSPWQPYFFDWAFNFPNSNPLEGGNQSAADKAAINCWAAIPNDTDILITHGPPYQILDNCPDGRMVGDKHLLNRIHELSNLKAHIFGHIHYSAGQKYQQLAKSNPIFVNAAICDERYMPVNPIQVVEI